MKKQEFLEKLGAKLSGLPKRDIEERLSFYGEMIDDRMEEGLSEENAVNDIGSVEEIAAQIVSEIPLVKIVKDKIKRKRRFTTGETVLLVLGSPLWILLLLVALIALVTVYAMIWALVATAWMVFGAFACTALGGLALSVVWLCIGKGVAAVAFIGGALLCAGLSILLFFAGVATTKGMVRLTKWIVVGLKNILIGKKEDA